ncbi:MAG: peptidoglycan DD-metalloendopeptidase family protein [Saprospiraceae bacterium]|nr:peptidoglycan DD-metalloendopeptidase family protein [Saprospiraceae bacterium]
MKAKFIILFLFSFGGTQVSATIWNVGPNKAYKKPSEVSNRVNDGDTVFIDAGTYLQDVCVWRAHHLYIVGIGGKAHLKSEGKAYGQKAIWVIQGDSTIIENIEFSECKVPDKNGAGIRLEATHLVVRSCFFHDNENGILAGNNINSDILVEHSEFARNGFGDGFSHNIYINHVRSLTFQFNHSHNSKVGHTLKSRAHKNLIQYNIINTGTLDGSYEIDIPNGGHASLIGNLIRQGPASQNSAMVSFGLEGLTNPEPHELFISHNTFVNDKSNGSFLNIRNLTNKLVLLNNIFAGAGGLYNGTVDSILDLGNLKNASIPYFSFINATSLDYRLHHRSPAINFSKTNMQSFPDLIPKWEYTLQGGIKLRKNEFWPEPGAFEIIELNPFHQPIEGQYGKDFIIVNYVDWALNGVLDHYCLDKTYDGHQGTDYVLSGYEHMSEGVYILAVDSGVVTSVRDGLFDMETVSDTSKGLGNYIAIQHGTHWFTYYGHLKKKSLLVKPGDRVYPGQRIASVGCSGNCTDPHLHFELWYDSLQLVDPMDGPCGNQFDFWANPIGYDSSFQVWKSGLIPGIASLDSLRFRQYTNQNYSKDLHPFISYWNLQYGMRKGDKVSVEWLNHLGQLIFQFDYVADKNYWYQYFWTYMTTADLGPCENCKCRYVRNGNLEEEIVFSINETSNSRPIESDQNIEIKGQYLINESSIDLTYKLISMHGQTIQERILRSGEKENLSYLNPGIYLLLQTGLNNVTHVNKLVIQK